MMLTLFYVIMLFSVLGGVGAYFAGLERWKII